MNGLASSLQRVCGGRCIVPRVSATGTAHIENTTVWGDIVYTKGAGARDAGPPGRAVPAPPYASRRTRTARRVHASTTPTNALHRNGTIIVLISQVFY